MREGVVVCRIMVYITQLNFMMIMDLLEAWHDNGEWC